VEITKNFSLFPYHLLKDLERSVVITKGDDFTPLLSDLDESKFADGIVKFFKRRKPVKVYNLGNKVSTFTGTLRELRAINFAHGDVSQLKSWLTKGEFPVTREDDNHIVLHDANLVVAKTAGGKSPSGAPDHLARLFASNQIMKQVGSSYFEEKEFPDDLVKEARKAYVVSPVSSLIVLETQQDYDRFGIADDGESLLNAKKNSSGAVPEPHEWVLIGVCLAMMTWMIIRRQKGLLLWK
jgi:XrtN system VIT domain protein